jgi:hypothetical protein
VPVRRRARVLRDLLPQVVVMIAIGPFVERIVEKLGTHRAATVSAPALVTGLLVYGLLGRRAYVWIAIALVLTGARAALVGWAGRRPTRSS